MVNCTPKLTKPAMLHTNATNPKDLEKVIKHTQNIWV